MCLIDMRHDNGPGRNRARKKIRNKTTENKFYIWELDVIYRRQKEIRRRKGMEKSKRRIRRRKQYYTGRKAEYKMNEYTRNIQREQRRVLFQSDSSTSETNCFDRNSTRSNQRTGPIIMTQPQHGIIRLSVYDLNCTKLIIWKIYHSRMKTLKRTIYLPRVHTHIHHKKINQ